MKLKFLLFPVLLCIFFWTIAPEPAEAACSRCCNCQTIRNYIIDEIKKHETWLIDVFWKQYLEPELTKMTNQIDNSLAEETTRIGGFTDAQNNIQKRQSLQELSAQTANNYQASEELCRFASLSESLAATDARARSNKIELMQRSQNRQLGQPNMVGSQGGSNDMKGRMVQFMTRYCDSNDDNGQMKNLCKTGSEDRFLNADIDFVRTFDAKPTLNVDFATAKTAPTDDEQDILALSDNLFGHDIFNRISSTELKGTGEIKDSRMAFMDMRSLIAKRSVAENSFNTLVAQKAQGTPGSKPYIAAVLKELGISDAGAMSYLGGNPSYDAQMEVLTKKIYQNPAFYVNLMDNPANVQRQYAAMQSFGLMQQRDMFDSILRSEMLLSLIVELEVAKYQDQAQALMDKK